jgi:hypothetical protein
MAGLSPAIHDFLTRKQRRSGPDYQLPDGVVAA